MVHPNGQSPAPSLSNPGYLIIRIELAAYLPRYWCATLVRLSPFGGLPPGTGGREGVRNEGLDMVIMRTLDGAAQ